MGGESPVVELYDSNGNPLSVQNNTAIPASTPGLLSMGSDGTKSRYITVDSSGNIVAVGAGVAGTPSGGVISIQGVASGTVVPVSVSGTVTISGTVTSNQGTANTLANAWPVEITDGSNVLGTSGHPIRIDPTGTTTQPVSGTVTANIGTTNGLALDTSVNGILVSQGSTTSGEKGPLIQGAVTTSAPSYTNAQTSPLSLTTAGSLRVDGTGGSFPISVPATTDNILATDKETFGSAVVGTRNTQIAVAFTQALANLPVTSSTTNGGTNTQSNGIATLATSTAVSGTASLQTSAVTQYNPGHECYVMFTAAFTTPTSANSNQRAGLYDTNNGFFVGYNGTSFGTTIRNLASDTFTASGSWNGDLLNGSAGSTFTRAGSPEAINFTKYNIYRIRFGWLGSAPIKYQVLSPDGNWVTFHTLRQPNSATTPSIASPNLPITFEALKASADSTNLQILTSSWEAGTTINVGTDTFVIGSLGALNATVQIATSGLNSVGMQLFAGTLQGTIVPEISMDGGITWVNSFFDDPVTGNKSSSIVFSSNNTATTRTIIGAGGASHSRVRVSSYTSGSATCNLHSSNIKDPSMLSDGAAAAALPPTVVQTGGSVTTSAPTYSTGTLNALSLDTSGNLRVTGSITGSVTATGSDTTASGTLGALNATVQIALAGQESAAMQLSAGTFVGFIIAQASTDGGATWTQVPFVDPATLGVTPSLTYSASNTAAYKSIYAPEGASHVRVTVSVYTSGSATVNLRATQLNRVSNIAGRTDFYPKGIRTDRSGNTKTGNVSIHLIEDCLGSAVNAFLWTTATSTMTITQSAGQIILNANGTTTNGTYADLISGRFFPLTQTPLRAYFFAAPSWVANGVLEMGIVNPSTNAAITTGAYFTIRGDGYVNCSVASAFGSLTTSVSGVAAIPYVNGTMPSYYFTVELYDWGARFIIDDNTGSNILDTNVLTQPSSPTFTGAGTLGARLPVFLRVRNTAGTSGTGGQIAVNGVGVYGIDIEHNKPWTYQMAATGRSAPITPGGASQTPQLTTNSAPSNLTPSNTGAGYGTLGGEYICNNTASSENLLSIFTFTIPTNTTFYLTGIFIPPPIVSGAAVGTTSTVLEFFAIVNCASTNISTGGGFRFTLPAFFSQTVTNGAVGNVFSGTQCNWTPQTPVACLPGTVLHIGYKVILGTATSSNRNRGSVYVDGFFE